MLVNEVFGELEFDYTWYKNEQINFGEKEVDIVVLVAGDEEGDFEQGQYEAYLEFKNKWSSIQNMLLESILEYYKKRREELGYDAKENERYPEIRSIDQLISHITLVGIKVPYAEMYGGRSIGLSFDCTWDDENGIGVRLSDERVIKIGFQDVAL